MPPLFDNIIFGLVGMVLISVGYVTYSTCFDSNVWHFFLFLLNPSGYINLPLDGTTILLTTLTPWLGIVEIGLRGIWIALPQKIKQYVMAFLILLAIMFLPLILLWCVWQFDVIIKIVWSVIYFWALWMQIYVIQSDI